MAEKAEGLITKEEKISQAKELYSRGSRNYLVKAYEEAADDLSQVCSLYEELYGNLSNELGMPYLLYAKSLIALALEENKVVDVPDEDEDDDDEDNDDDNEEGVENAEAGTSNTKDANEKKSDDDNKEIVKEKEEKTNNDDKKIDDKKNDDKTEENVEEKPEKEEKSTSETNGEKSVVVDASKTQEEKVNDKNIEAKPGPSNGVIEEEDTAQENDDGDDAATNLQVAWEILELAAKIFQNQGESALPNLAEVYTELGNIEFENNIMQSARDDYNKALEIYKELSSNYRRPMAEINYKIGLSYLMEQVTRESAEFLKNACNILDDEINEIKNKENLTEKDKLNLQDMEETKQEIWVKITEIEESMQQCISDVRAAIQNHMNPIPNPEYGESSSSTSLAAVSSSAAGSSSTAVGNGGDKPKPTDISHLIKRKKPDTDNNDMSPAKRPAT